MCKKNARTYSPNEDNFKFRLRPRLSAVYIQKPNVHNRSIKIPYASYPQNPKLGSFINYKFQKHQYCIPN